MSHLIKFKDEFNPDEEDMELIVEAQKSMANALSVVWSTHKNYAEKKDLSLHPLEVATLSILGIIVHGTEKICMLIAPGAGPRAINFAQLMSLFDTCYIGLNLIKELQDWSECVNIGDTELGIINAAINVGDETAKHIRNKHNG